MSGCLDVGQDLLVLRLSSEAGAGREEWREGREEVRRGKKNGTKEGEVEGGREGSAYLGLQDDFLTWRAISISSSAAFPARCLRSP